MNSQIDNNGFSPDLVDAVDQSTVDRNEAAYPIIQWHRGAPNMKKVGGMDYQGGWFVGENMAPTDLTGYGWERTTWQHDEASETEGYYRRELTVAVIRDRKRWEVSSGGRRFNYAWKDYDEAQKAGRPTGRTHILVLIRGMEDLGPFVLTLKGMAGVYFTGTQREKGALTHFDATIVRAANDAVKKAGKRGMMPRRAFWLTVGAQRDEKGAPIFTKVGTGDNTSQMVAPVALGLPDKPDDAAMKAAFVGQELFARVSDLYREADEWAGAWENIAPGQSDDGGGNGDAAPAGRAAQPVNETDVAEAVGL